MEHFKALSPALGKYEKGIKISLPKKLNFPIFPTTKKTEGGFNF